MSAAGVELVGGERPTEETRLHTRIQRLALGAEESRAYWSNVDPTVPTGPRAIQAFEQRWFGTKSLTRVRILTNYLAFRYDSFPDSFDVLRAWSKRGMAPATRTVICHWHLQLSDPLYRRYRPLS